MKVFKALSNLLHVLSVVARRKDQVGLADLLQTVSAVVREGDEAGDQLQKIAEDIDRMVAEGVDPTAEQFAEVAAKRKELSDEIQDVDLGDEDEDEDDELPDDVTPEDDEDGNEEPA